MSELAERLNCLFDLTHKIYSLLNKSLTADLLSNPEQSLARKKNTLSLCATIFLLTLRALNWML